MTLQVRNDTTKCRNKLATFITAIEIVVRYADANVPYCYMLTIKNSV